MFSLTSSNVTGAQLRNSSARLSRRVSHSVQIIGAAAIALTQSFNGDGVGLRERDQCGVHRSPSRRLSRSLLVFSLLSLGLRCPSRFNAS